MQVFARMHQEALFLSEPRMEKVPNTGLQLNANKTIVLTNETRIPLHLVTSTGETLQVKTGGARHIVRNSITTLDANHDL